MMVQFTKAPLPFIGQKRNYLKQFRKALLQCAQIYGDDLIILDAFGGSGLLSHTAKQLLPKARVIYNDFDKYSERLQYIDDTNRLFIKIQKIIPELPKNTKLTESQKRNIVDLLENFDGYIDIQTVRTWLLFSGRQISSYAELINNGFYYRIPKAQIDAAGYLQGVEIVHSDFKPLLDAYYHTPNCVFVLDPPYINAEQYSYSSYLKSGNFGVVDFIQVMDKARPPYILFSSSKTQILQYMDYIAQNKADDHKRLGGFTNETILAKIGKDRQYQDNMLYKIQ